MTSFSHLGTFFHRVITSVTGIILGRGHLKCQWLSSEVVGQNANRTRLFSVVGILSVPTFWLAFCPDHLNMFWHFVRIMKITFYEIAKSICKTGSDEGKLSQLLRTLCNAMRKSLGKKFTQCADFFS